MFDIGFLELLIIGAAALIVIGPERLPEVMRELGHAIGSVKRYLHRLQVELTSQLDPEQIIKPLQDDLSKNQQQLLAPLDREAEEISKIIVPDTAQREHTPSESPDPR